MRERGVEFDAIEYLKSPPTQAALELLVAMLEESPAELVRKDKRFKELGLSAESYTTGEQVVALLLEYPELMQRPIIVRGKRAVIARPPEKLELLLKAAR